MALYVLTHGIGLIALAILTRRVASEIAQVTWITGLAGGSLCVLWGTLGLLGHRRRVGVVLTLIPVWLVLTTQTVSGWMERLTGETTSSLVLALATLMLVASLSLLAYVLHAGDQTTNPARRQPGGKE